MSKLYHATAEEMKALDAEAVKRGIDIRQMMELAGWHMLAIFKKLRIKQNARIVVVAGKGNKGGDGIAAARHLSNNGYSVQIIMLAKRISKESKHHLNIADAMGVPIWYWKDSKSTAIEILGSADVVIDALIGYRLEGSPRNQYAEIIEGLNMKSTKMISYDLPTGVNPTTGVPTAHFIKADATLSLALPKKLFESAEARKYCGRIFLADIGIPSYVYDVVHARSRPDFKGDIIELT
jgi:NAD(P)H-hydrate epimerase